MLIYNLISTFNQFLKDTFDIDDKSISNVQYDFNIEQKRISFRDFSSNAPLVLAKLLKQNPIIIAQRITSSFSDERIEKIEIAGIGFLNIILNNIFYDQLIENSLNQIKQNSLIIKTTNPLSYNIEFVSANPTGPLHIGHGRGGIIGDVLGNLLRELGHRVTKEFYVNDAGKQIEKLGQSLLIRIQQILGKEIELGEGMYHGTYLIDIAQQLIKDNGKEKTELMTIEELGNVAKDYLLEKIKVSLENYGIHFDLYFSEKSLYQTLAIDKALDQLNKEGHLFEENGALFFKTTETGDDKDRVLKKTDGTFTYAASDVAYLKNKMDRSFDRLVMVLGQDHHSYVQRLHSMMIALGYNSDYLRVILYQLVTVKENNQAVRLSKRAGRIVSLDDIISEVGKDVSRFFYLHRKADAHLDFDIDLALETSDKNPVYYIHYAYVRLCSMLKKAKEMNILWEEAMINEKSYDYNLLEKMIFRKLELFQKTLENISQNYETHVLSYYVFDLSSLFHSYYAEYICIDKNNNIQTVKRLRLIYFIKNVLDKSFDILGLTKFDQM